MDILHGENLMISIDSVTVLAAKTCDIKIKSSSQKKSSPTSGQWEEVVAGRKSWSVATNHLVYAGTQQTLPTTNIFTLNAYNGENGWRVLGECGSNIIDQRQNVDEGIYIMKIAKQTGVAGMAVYIESTAWDDLADYLTDNFSSEDYIFIIATVGRYAIDRATCTLLNETYHVALPFVELGGMINNEEVLVDTPLIMMGGKGISQGMVAYGQTENVIKATFYNGVLPMADGLTGFTSLVGKMCTLRMKNTSDNSIMAGQALCTEFDVSAAKNSLMKGSFSWQGNGELKSSAFAPTTKTLEPYVNYITINMNKQNPSEMITGDINGNIIQQIRSSFHRYVAVLDEGELKICKLDDNNSTLFPDGTTAVLDGTRGDVMVKHSTFYTSVQDYGNGIFKIGFTLNNLGTGWKEWNENDMIGAYEGSVTTTADGNTERTTDDGNGYLRSISGIYPIGNVQAQYYETKASNTGYGFTGIKLRHHNLMGILLIALTGTTNSQAVFGNGVPMGSSNIIAQTGATNEIGMNDTYAGIVGSVNFCGLENWWGNMMEFMNNVQYGGTNTWYVWANAHTAPRYETNGLNIGNHSINTGYIAKMALGENLDLIPTSLQEGITVDYKGNSQTGFCDIFELRTGEDDTDGIARGNGVDATDDMVQGAFFLYAGLSGTSKFRLLGTRLCYQGSFTEVTPTQYKALFNSY